MKLTRNITTKINSIPDNFVPPFLRDSKICMYLPFRLMYGNKAHVFFNFKKQGFAMSKEEFCQTYIDIDKVLIKRDTDLNDGCIEEICRNIVGKSALEVGCGKALLANTIQKLGFDITAIDICVDENLKKSYPNIKFQTGDIEDIKFGDKTFDTVVSTHTLEHVQNLSKAISELRRVCKKRLIVVVPKQRPYKYTFDLHLHFFPYEFLFLEAMGGKYKGTCRVIGGDIFYTEDIPQL